MPIDVVDKWIKWNKEHKDEIAIDVDLYPEYMAAYRQFCKAVNIPFAPAGIPKDVETNET